MWFWRQKQGSCWQEREREQLLSVGEKEAPAPGVQPATPGQAPEEEYLGFFHCPDVAASSHLLSAPRARDPSAVQGPLIAGSSQEV